MTATTYQRQYHSFDEENKFDVNGEIVHVTSAPKGLAHGAEVLVELSGESEEIGVEDDENGPEGIPEDHHYLCNYDLGDGRKCSREVSEAGERCWQHPQED